jgi:Domain of unknown function (DUF4402)
MLRNLFLVILLVLVAATSFAQLNANTNMGASATVLTALTITKNTDVAFGNIGATTAGQVYLDPKAAASTYVGTTATVGTLTIAGANSQSIRLTWPPTLSLSDGASHTMTYTLKVNGLSANTQASSGTLTLTSGYYDATTSAGGAYYLWVGGDLGTLASQVTGTYTGTANFTVEYN